MIRRRLGLFGGTFDPVHFGHLRASEEVRERLHLDRVILVPNCLPPHKARVLLTRFEHRWNMLRLAIGRTPHLDTSRVEGDRGGRSYTIDTVEQLQRTLGRHTSIYLILGHDSFVEMPTWRRWSDLLTRAHVVVMTRPDRDGRVRSELGRLPLVFKQRLRYSQASGVYKNTSGYTLRFVRITPLAVSATAIRRARREKKSIRYLTPDRVLRYIEENGLYR